MASLLVTRCDLSKVALFTLKLLLCFLLLLAMHCDLSKVTVKCTSLKKIRRPWPSIAGRSSLTCGSSPRTGRAKATADGFRGWCQFPRSEGDPRPVYKRMHHWIL